MDKPFEGKRSRKYFHSLAESIQSLTGLKASLTSSWAESVCHIIKALPSTEPSGSSGASTPSFKKLDASQKKNTTITSAVPKVQDDLAALNAQINELNLERRHALNDLLDLKGNIRVFCRVRPFLLGEKCNHLEDVVVTDSSNVLLKFAENKRKNYSFDKVFHPGSSQDEVFSEVEPVIKSALDGYNVCIFAYGQTGTGKTFSMEGEPDYPGIVPRALEALFKQALESNHTFVFTFSMLEIYMGSLQDLLIPQSRKITDPSLQCLSIKTDPLGGVEIDNLVAIRVSNANQARKLYRLGCHFRSTAFTESNVSSSRSHCLIRLLVTCFDACERQRETNKIWMVDLGGSERLLKTQARGKRLEEGKAINLSLSALGDVISALQKKRSHVPYRNSKLTQVLRDSLGKDSKTLMLVHVSPREEDLCETVCSLGFATRVRSIQLGHEKSAEIRVKKEIAMAELLQKVKRLEYERQEVKRDVEKLQEKMKYLMGMDPLTDKNSELSDLSHEEAPSNTENQKKKLRLPRFMRPTVCSRQKSSIEHNSLESAMRKPLPVRRRKASSVRAESVTFPINGTSKSEYGSDVVGFSSRYSTDYETEFSHDISECDVKMVVLPEVEKPLKSLVGLASSVDIESINNWARRDDKTDFDQCLAIDNWVHLQKHTPSNITRWTKRVLAIPLPGEKTRNNKQNQDIKETEVSENINVRISDVVCMEGNDQDFPKKELCNQQVTEQSPDRSDIIGWSSEHSKLYRPQIKEWDRPLSVDLMNNWLKQDIDSHSAVQKEEVLKERLADSVEMNETNFDSKYSHDTLGKDEVFKETMEASVEMHETNVDSEISVALGQADCTEALELSEGIISETMVMGDFHDTSKHMEDGEKLSLHLMKSSRALLMNQRETTMGDSIVPVVEFHCERQKKGAVSSRNNTRICLQFAYTVQMLCASALLGLGIESLGLGHDFFHGLIL